MSAPTTGQLADIPDHLPAIAPPIGPAVDVLAGYFAFLTDRARLARNPDVKLAYEKAANRFRVVDEAVAELIEAGKRMLESYKAAHDSGDWGNWDLEKDDEYVALRTAIARVGGAA